MPSLQRNYREINAALHCARDAANDLEQGVKSGALERQLDYTDRPKIICL
jgi:hypothetical protein